MRAAILEAFGATIFALVSATATAPAEARPAKCFATDEGHYACDFAPLGGGSFRLTARGKPSYTLDIVEPGVAAGFLGIDNRTIRLPGLFRRNAADRACWDNDATAVRICAW